MSLFVSCWAPSLLCIWSFFVVPCCPHCALRGGLLISPLSSFPSGVVLQLRAGLPCSFVSFCWDSAQGPRLRVGLSLKVVGIATPDPVSPSCTRSFPFPFIPPSGFTRWAFFRFLSFAIPVSGFRFRLFHFGRCVLSWWSFVEAAAQSGVASRTR